MTIVVLKYKIIVCLFFLGLSIHGGLKAQTLSDFENIEAIADSGFFKTYIKGFVGYGTQKNFVDLIMFTTHDDSTITFNPQDTLQRDVAPAENLVLVINTQFLIKKYLHIKFESVVHLQKQFQQQYVILCISIMKQKYMKYLSLSLQKIVTLNQLRKQL